MDGRGWAVREGHRLVQVGMILFLAALPIGLAVQQFAVPLAANLLGALWGAGNTLLPIAAGPAHGSPVQEGITTSALRTGGTALIAASVLIVWGLRALPSEPAG
jgi:hypothetical protein